MIISREQDASRLFLCSSNPAGYSTIISPLQTEFFYIYAQNLFIMKKNFTNTFPAIVTFLLCSLSAIAQWTEIPIPIGASMPGGMKLLNGNVYTSYYSGFRVKCIRTSDYIHWSQIAELPATSSFGTSRVIPDGQHLYLFAFNRTQQTASAWKSTNEGQNWQLVNLPSPRPGLFTPVGDVLLAASDLAVQRIVNGSATWNITLTTPQRIWDMKRLDERVSTVSFTLEGKHPNEVAKQLGDAGFYVWDGHYYALAVVERLGLLDKGGMIRVGAAHYNTLAEIESFGEALQKIAGG